LADLDSDVAFLLRLPSVPRSDPSALRGRSERTAVALQDPNPSWGK
jgi:hypothetical protein